MRSSILKLVERDDFKNFVTLVVVINAVTLGLETWPFAMDRIGGVLRVLDTMAITIFVIEIGLKLFAHRLNFFRSGWNVFDFVIVGVALVPSAGAFSVLRTLRILRALRLLSVVPQMRAVVGALLGAVPGMGAIVAVLLLVFYIAAVMATKLFAATFPDWFGSVPSSMYTLFQIMTLESWSMGIVRPVMDVHPWSWVFFVPFIIVTSFAVLNLFIALIVDSMQAMHAFEDKEDADKKAAVAHSEREALMAELRAVREELAELRGTLKKA